MVNDIIDRNPSPVPEAPDEQPAEPFKTPEAVAAEDTKPKLAETPAPPDTKDQTNPVKTSKLAGLKAKLKERWHSFSKKQKIIIVIVAGIVLLGAISGLIFALTRHPAKPKPAVVKVLAPKPTTVPSTLTGLPVDPSVNKRPVTGVMIENSPDARPQSGLDQAGVVFEAVAEGGVTRFLALFQDTQPNYIGPVRSARPYYVAWDLGFDAPYAHVGGSPDALSDISAWDVKDLNEFYNAGAFERIDSREAPHNVYTSIGQLRALENSKGFKTSHFDGFPRKSDSPAAKRTAASISMSLSGPDYSVGYTYSPKNNNYLRSEGGEPHMEIVKGGKPTRITPKVVIAIVVPESQGALDASGAYYSDYAVIGSGKVYVFQDGIVTIGTWHKASKTSQITFTDAQLNPIKLNAGQTWITAISSAANVSYLP